MSMTREEAENWFLDHIPLKIIMPIAYDAYSVAIRALRPVSGEQVERMFPGCPYCKSDSEGYVKKFGAYSIQNGELTTGHCKPQKIRFCPACGAPMTDEAVDILLKRLEE